MVKKREKQLNKFRKCFFFARLDCFYTLTDSGKRIDLVDDRLRGIVRIIINRSLLSIYFLFSSFIYSINQWNSEWFNESKQSSLSNSERFSNKSLSSTM